MTSYFIGMSRRMVCLARSHTQLQRVCAVCALRFLGCDSGLPFGSCCWIYARVCAPRSGLRSCAIIYDNMNERAGGRFCMCTSVCS